MANPTGRLGKAGGVRLASLLSGLPTAKEMQE